MIINLTTIILEVKFVNINDFIQNTTTNHEKICFEILYLFSDIRPSNAKWFIHFVLEKMQIMLLWAIAALESRSMDNVSLYPPNHYDHSSLSALSLYMIADSRPM